jgi:hypothetical protein
MKLTAATLLIVFCALLGVQGACALGWQVHDECAAAQGHPGHEDSCDFDPCRQSVDPPVLVSPRACEPAAPRPAAPLTGQRATCPRPAGLFPLLI